MKVINEEVSKYFDQYINKDDKKMKLEGIERKENEDENGETNNETDLEDFFSDKIIKEIRD